MGIRVVFGGKIQQELLNFLDSDLAIINAFVEHVERNGFVGLAGRNKPSHEVPTDDPHWREKVRYAQEHNLWHYHIGIPSYAEGVSGDKTSAYILHYIRGGDVIKIVDFNQHPPFRLPTTDYLA